MPLQLIYLDYGCMDFKFIRLLYTHRYSPACIYSISWEGLAVYLVLDLYYCKSIAVLA